MTNLRIGIDVRFVEGIFGRGMGRYTLQQLHAVIQATPQHQYVLFCLKKTPPSVQAFAKYPNVTLENRFVRYNLHLFVKNERYLTALTRLIDRLAWEHRLDVVHVPILLNFIQPVPTQLTSCAVVMTIYDLIPLIFAEHFPQPVVALYHYQLGINRFKTSDYLIAISQATKHDVMRLLDYPAERIGVAYPAVDTAFMRQNPAQTASLLTGLWARLNIPAPAQYMFTVTDHFYTKNLETLLRAYAQYPADVTAHTPLVVTFDIYPKDRIRFMEMTKELGIGERVIFTGRVSEDELVALYNEALFTVYPSRYEGFGYPIAEAMACGSPVITTTAASMPEVAGDVALLVDPEDAEAMTDAMHKLYTTPTLRADLREKGLIQAQKFNLQALAEATLNAYVATASLKTRPAEKPDNATLYERYRLVQSRYVYAIKRILYDKMYLPIRKHIPIHRR
jgi:glycosyltransferase involved in cell wall biosynthesis